MGKFQYFKIRSEVEDNLDLGADGLFDNTEEHIIRISQEMYQEDFEKLLIEFGRPLNQLEDFDTFIIWLTNDKKITAEYVEFNFIQNYSELKVRHKK